MDYRKENLAYIAVTQIAFKFKRQLVNVSGPNLQYFLLNSSIPIS